MTSVSMMMMLSKRQYASTHRARSPKSHRGLSCCYVLSLLHCETAGQKGARLASYGLAEPLKVGIIDTTSLRLRPQEKGNKSVFPSIADGSRFLVGRMMPLSSGTFAGSDQSSIAVANFPSVPGNGGIVGRKEWVKNREPCC